ncbi:hypothetical protein KAR91_07595 [Candidatus Pacearchaeota archaeon]|nr:hypothetical protein [Candidatus Pacearchaeota archaeon]
MTRDEVEAEILCLSAELLLGKATKEDIGRVVSMAMENGCLDIIKREFTDIRTKIHRT